METTNILAIGNSFSEDAAAWLYPLSKNGGLDIKIANLYIGGCTLEMHWNNVLSKKEEYIYQQNGNSEGRRCSIQEALDSEEWDFVVMQQASYLSGEPETYYPYLLELSAYVKKKQPQAIPLIHQTWAYETNSTHDGFSRYSGSQSVMYTRLKAAYAEASKRTGFALIPCGNVIQELRRYPDFDILRGGRSLCRDGYHLDFLYGRYAAAAVWYETILNSDIRKNAYLPPAKEAISQEKISLIKKVVHEICSQYSLKNC